MRQRLVLLLAALFLVAAESPAPSSAPVPTQQAVPSLGWIHGDWHGSIRIFGRAGEARLAASPVLRGSATAFAWRVEVPAAGGKPAFIFEARGTYIVATDGKVRGQWSDSQGHLHPLAGKVSGSSMIVTWGEPATEIGQSSYRIEADGSLLISDSGLVKGAIQPFSEASLSRR